jgi:hypothetical protein
VNDQRIVLRQRRDLGEIIQAALNLYQQNFVPFFLIAAVVIPLGIAGAALAPDPIDPGETYELDGETFAFLGIALVAALVSVLASAAIIVSLPQIDQGRTPEFSLAYDGAFERYGAILMAVLRAAVIVFLLSITILGIPWAIQRVVRWLFVTQAIILDKTTASDALSKSAGAVAGRWWRTLGIALVIFLIARVPASIIAGLFSVTPPVIGGTISSLVEALLLPLGTIAMTLLYFDLQVRKESDERTAANTPA